MATAHGLTRIAAKSEREALVAYASWPRRQHNMPMALG